ncbi:hypothetical protein DYBT9623_04457 [Dyadobacter sp. CECT 9623]|uniref:DNA (cytosine-5-)-methyltransferase n=1 Tax=Dyadobacter linearis TaxID=2823330 RepID=A0ABN7RGR9_9BACT|nr:DNA (cytosine-5-)-methyltransferase [Dyadobacter sp. CECT 9623]CAG5072920.1 hypothetical protein DYBT9623_04457 [Dyadobacter sp. CECT 9623]
MIHFSEFSGIGGFDLASQMMGWSNYLSCEINPFGNKVLNYYWPNAYHHTDIKTLTYATIDTELSSRYGSGWRNDDIILTGGFPCQPYSSAGKRLGKEDDRHLWPEMLRTIQEIQPTWVVGENVRGLTNWNGGMVFNEVCADLEALGYEVLPFLLPACAVDAPHRRDRVWFIAYADSKRYRGRRHGHGELEKGPVRSDQQVNRDGVWSEDTACGEAATDSTSDRRVRKGAEPSAQNRQARSKQPRLLERGFERLRAYGLTPNTKSKRLGKERSNIIRPEERYSGNGIEWTIANANQFDGDLSRFRTGKASQQQKTGLLFDNAAYSDSQQRLEGRLHTFERKATERYSCAFDSRDGGSAWQNFPTQPPVCFGNDGLSRRLDRAAILAPDEIGKRRFSHTTRWRTESIKAAGNAIVPWVAFQIFKSIQSYVDSCY